LASIDTSSSNSAEARSRGFEPSPAVVLGSLVVLMLALQLPFLTEAYRITVDEPWYSQTAHSITIDHGIQNEVVGSGGGDVFFLHPLILSTIFEVSGTSFYAGRLGSVLFGVLALLGFGRILYRLDVGWIEVLLCGIAFTVSNLSYLAFRAIRPEAAAAAFAVWGGYFLFETLRSRSWVSGALCGLAVGAAFLAHPALAIFVVLVGLALLIDAARSREFSALVAYSGVGLIVLSVLLVFMQSSNPDGIAGALAGMSSRAVKVDGAAMGLLSSTFDNAASFFSRLHSGGRRAPIVLLEILVVAWGLANLRRLGRGSAMPLIAVGFLAVGFVALRPMSLRSFMIVEWMVVATFGLLITEIAKAGVAWKTSAARAALIVLILNNLAGDLYLIQRDYDAKSYSELSSELSAAVPAGSTVLSHMLFWFPFQESSMYSSYTRWQYHPYADLDGLLESGDVDYVVLLDHDGLSRLVRGATGAAAVPHGVVDYRDRVHAWVEPVGTLTNEITAKGYGTIKVWSLNSR
jgi:hypothetical protein